MATENSLPALLQAFYERIAIDFGVATRPLAERAQILERVSSMILRGAVMRAIDVLDEEESEHIDDLLAGGGENNPENASMAVIYIAERVPDFGFLMTEAYEEIKSLAIQMQKAREKRFEHADDTAEAVGDLWGVVEDGVEAVKVDVPGLPLVGIGVDLFFDPARFLRSARERQKRFFKNVAVLCSKTMGAAWAGLLLFTVFDVLERRHIISSLPDFVREAVPNWFEHQSIGGQMLSLVLLAAGLILVGLVGIQLAVRAGVSPRLTPAFETKVRDDELASTVLKSSFLPSLFPGGAPQGTVWRSCATIYRGIYINSGRANSDDLKILDEILKGGNEKVAVAFLKSKVRDYRSAMRDEVQRYCSEAAGIMEKIK